jgi:hypothetical protein
MMESHPATCLPRDQRAFLELPLETHYWRKKATRKFSGGNASHLCNAFCGNNFFLCLHVVLTGRSTVLSNLRLKTWSLVNAVGTDD